MLSNQHSFSLCDKLKLLAAHVNKLQGESDEQNHKAGLLGFLKSQATQACDHYRAWCELMEMV